MENRYFISSTIVLAFAILPACYGSDSVKRQQPEALKDTIKTEAPISDRILPQGMPASGNVPHGAPPEGLPPNGMPPPGERPGGPPPGGFGPGGEVNTGKGAYVLTDNKTLEGGTYKSTKDDENVIRAEGGITATLHNVMVEKTGGSVSSNEASSFYGLNAAILALDGATLNINGGQVTATTEGSNGVFAYDGATINIKNTRIDVSGGNAGGIEVSGGGKMYVTNLTVNAAVKAAIRSDRGGGTIVVDGGTYTTRGSAGAPAIYSTADITVSNATLVSNNSEAVVIEGFNSVTINNSHITGNMRGIYGKENGVNIQNVMLYQSMSGDAKLGTSTFTMNGGSLVSLNGDMFYVTNTSSIINLSGVKLTPAEGTYLILVAGNNNSRGWGNKGANGGTCEFNLTKQTISGNILVDSISKLTVKISNSSSYTGAINSNGTAALSISVTIDDSSTWTLTGDSYITGLNGSTDRVILNGHTLYVNGKSMFH
jgi:ribosomal protein L24